MIRGADTQFIFDIPCSCTDVGSAKVTFWQPENSGISEYLPLPIVKSVTIPQPGEIGSAEKQLSVVLTAAETLRFSDKRKAYAQMVIIKTNGVCIPGKQEIITVYPARDELFGDVEDVVFDGDIYINGGNVAYDTGSIVSIDSGAINTI